MITERTRTELGLPDVDQHVGVGAVPHGQVVVVPAVVVLDRLLLGAPRHDVVVEFTPLGRKFYRKVILTRKNKFLNEKLILFLACLSAL